MKNMYKTALVIAFAFVLASIGSPIYAAAATAGDTTSFGVTVTDISRVPSTGATRFLFEPSDLKNGQNIAYWKMRVYCEGKKVSIEVNELDENVCGKAVKMVSADRKFALFLSNSTGKTTLFSFKLKAYDKDGNWLHTEKKSFQWK